MGFFDETMVYLDLLSKAAVTDEAYCLEEILLCHRKNEYKIQSSQQ